MMIIWFSSSHKKFYIWETVSINFDTYLSTKRHWCKHRVHLLSSCQSLALCQLRTQFACQVLDRDVDGAGLCKGAGTTVSDFLLLGQPEPHFVQTGHYPGEALSPGWASMSPIPARFPLLLGRSKHLLWCTVRWIWLGGLIQTQLALPMTVFLS